MKHLFLFLILCMALSSTANAQHYVPAEPIKAIIEQGLADSTKTKPKSSRKSRKYIHYRENEPSLRKIKKLIDWKDVDIYVHNKALEQEPSLIRWVASGACCDLITAMKDSLVRNDYINCYYYAIHKDPVTKIQYALVRDQDETMFFIADSTWYNFAAKIMCVRGGHPGYYDLSRWLCYHFMAHNKAFKNILSEWFYPYEVKPYVEKEDKEDK